MPDQGAEKGVTVPSPASLLDVQVDDRVTIRVRRHGNPEGPRIMMTHGCGLAADTYFPFWKSLLDRYDLILFDLRSHVGIRSAISGRTTSTPSPTITPSYCGLLGNGLGRNRPPGCSTPCPR